MVPVMVLAEDGLCGLNNSCPPGYCCSKDGYCGKGPAWCGKGCKGGECDLIDGHALQRKVDYVSHGQHAQRLVHYDSLRLPAKRVIRHGRYRHRAQRLVLNGNYGHRTQRLSGHDSRGRSAQRLNRHSSHRPPTQRLSRHDIQSHPYQRLNSHGSHDHSSVQHVDQSHVHKEGEQCPLGLHDCDETYNDMYWHCDITGWKAKQNAPGTVCVLKNGQYYVEHDSSIYAKRKKYFK
ncbi:hypothetical protein IWQ62_003617 [Dispira parvispora]|uniref:Chitin-binding type-1 domain-containing protein n=1 Tax=Dispira parvispora TaxID=1520584 RepID=A0A9W8E1G9_9FUNG|nr:hypothetical protein IWQ62_003617 [Dispira parvispora]